MPDNCYVFDLDMIEAALSQGHPQEVQFDRPFGDQVHVIKLDADGEMIDGPGTPTAEYLARLNALCASYKEALNVRFYGFYSEVFDAACLTRLPEIRALTVNCLHDAINLERIVGLEHLTRLQLGVHQLTNKALLSDLPVARLTHLTLEEASTRALDLAPLAGAAALRELRVFGHHKNIASLACLANLTAFTYNPAKDVPLDFVNGMTGLTALKLVLGGTATLAGITLPTLRDLAATQVRGLTDIGDLSRFPALDRVLLQDQQNFTSLDFGTGGKLRHLWLYNCRALATLPGLARLPTLQSLFVGRTALSLADLDLPENLTHLVVTTATARDAKAEEAAVRDLGLIPDAHDDMPFFYK